MKTISMVGEKAFIRDFIKPYFNAKDDPAGVGDDCAMIEFGDEVALISTDRVPSDLTAFKLKILNFHGLGDYLARLNLSDIAACGGKAVALLLNLGLPNDIAYEDVQALCQGFGEAAQRHGAAVLGGDMTSACELSASATSIGRTLRGHVLTRRGAAAGDSIFVSRPIGLTPAAFLVFLGKLEAAFSEGSLAALRRQFTDMQPMLPLGQALSESGQCGACMDNTDGIGQSLSELSEASRCAFVIRESALQIPSIVAKVAEETGRQALDIIFNGGADFSLVGTVRGRWTNERASAHFGHTLEIIGQVENGQGVWLEGKERKPLLFRGWNYFCAQLGSGGQVPAMAKAG